MDEIKNRTKLHELVNGQVRNRRGIDVFLKFLSDGFRWRCRVIKVLRHVRQRHPRHPCHVCPWLIGCGNHNGCVHLKLLLQLTALCFDPLLLEPKFGDCLFRLREFASDTVHIHDALSRVVMAQNLGVAFAEVGSFFLSDLVARDEGCDLVRELFVGLFVTFEIGNIGG